MTIVEPILPPHLKTGDTIGVFHPAGPIQDRAVFESGLHILRGFGLQVRHHHPDDSGPDYLAAGDEERVRELHTLWADDEVKGLITARGGYGCLRIINHLDLDFLRSHPKWLRLEILRPTMGQGRLIGGNLTTLTHLIGTQWQPQFAGNILFLEDTAEPGYKLDRMFTHLSCCGLLDNLSGLILGVFDPGHDDSLEMIRLSEQIWNRVLELTRSTGYPIWGGFPAGHQRDNYPLPIGMEVVMDSATGTLEFLPQSCLRADVY
jgi:muramoyltetrapeptide carboxypeptidase LdcA involved in peptidoglycan recycling